MREMHCRSLCGGSEGLAALNLGASVDIVCQVLTHEKPYRYRFSELFDLFGVSLNCSFYF